MLKRTFLTLCAAGAFAMANAQTQYTIAADKVKAHIQPTMYGIFFEDINLAADGGVYAELVKNRSFEFNMPLMGWKEQKKDGGDGRTEVINRAVERPENAHFIKSYITGDAGFYGFSNEGFRGGMGVKEGEEYSFSVIAKQEGDTNVKLNIELHGDNGDIIGKAELTPTDKEWNRYSVKFKSTATTPKAQLYVWMSGKGVIDLDMISLFPEHTWKNRPGGLRADLVQRLADLKPGFLRFPGGCIVEGRELNNRYQWKKTIGPVDKRENIINRWNTEFKHRPAPDYYQTFGLGFMEYFMTAEDIGASPLPILNCGMACEFNTGELVPLDKLDPYVQDALDLIEFANGDASTKWGKLRTDLGHPAPFNLKMIGVGNEQWGPQYIDRWKIFTKAIKTKYPDVKIVSALGPSPEGKEFDLLNKTFRSLGADILDEHYYAPAKWFRDNARRYDNYDRKGPKIFAGEYAAQSVSTVNPDNKNNWECALSEAAFMTGLERNADVVNMASYAPLFAHVEGWQWTPNLIWFDNLKSYATPNYYVQQLFSINKGTDVVPLTLNNEAVAGQNDSYATASLDKNTNELVIKFVNTSTSAQNVSFKITGSKGYQKQATVTTLKADSKDAENSLTAPTAVSPVESTIDISGNTLKLAVEPYSFKIVRLKNK
ncbi:alpha-L-arabinofuranosidase C-terminal domain-containing protein [Mucilaginibacter rubeus]|uniref:non-reducing end alpha-L-arabinofuranosidase n=1 Tax=Mucilaginibacter rubeus TaxID=2027860 RepID=A0A5C1I7X7_9SPHI|nr:alpha-L-arabinofuranosidase C-terminal domain-containing protein [Mucilaginibacter rubeus]QEM14169.1 alpha-L-arabinofuranosidase [Mucilaginibacter rubeus]